MSMPFKCGVNSKRHFKGKTLNDEIIEYCH